MKAKQSNGNAVQLTCTAHCTATYHLRHVSTLVKSDLLVSATDSKHVELYNGRVAFLYTVIERAVFVSTVIKHTTGHVASRPQPVRSLPLAQKYLALQYYALYIHVHVSVCMEQ